MFYFEARRRVPILVFNHIYSGFERRSSVTEYSDAVYSLNYSAWQCLWSFVVDLCKVKQNLCLRFATWIRVRVGMIRYSSVYSDCANRYSWAVCLRCGKVPVFTDVRTWLSCWANMDFVVERKLPTSPKKRTPESQTISLSVLWLRYPSLYNKKKLEDSLILFAFGSMHST